MQEEMFKQVVEALVFASDTPITVKQIKEIVEDTDARTIKKAIDSLNHDYTQSERAFSIIELAGGYQMMSRDKYAQWVKKLYIGKLKSRLSQAALETLSMIAFKQPVSRTEIDSIRGVNSGGVIKNLLERRLIRITGRADGPGKPLIYSTTKEFLQYFGINDINDLPKPREIEELLKDDKLSDEVEAAREEMAVHEKANQDREEGAAKPEESDDYEKNNDQDDAVIAETAEESKESLEPNKNASEDAA